MSASQALAAYDPSDPTENAEYDNALALGVQAYKYGLPLLDMNRIRQTYTSVNVCDPVTAYGPPNTFCHARTLADPSERNVVAPNHDTLYSVAWLNLGHGDQPQVIHVPSTPDHYHVFELVDMWTTNFQNIGSPIALLYPNPSTRPYALPDGDYIVAGPDQQIGRGQAKGLPIIRADTSNVWVIGRTIVKNEADVPNVNRIQDGYKIAPLNKFGKNWSPKPPKVVDRTPNAATIPGTQPGANPLDFFDALGDDLVKYPPYPADEPLLDKLATVGIGVGLHPSQTQNDAVKAGLAGAVTTAGPAAVNHDLQVAYLTSFAAHNGWLVGDAGTYGTDYARRAIVDKIGVGALDSRVATYPFTQTDANLQPLTGAKRYVAHFAPGTAPPVQNFWSLTLYDTNQFLVPNPANRYLVNDRSNLHYNPDGSLDIYIQPNPPTNQAQYDNWLPSPLPGDPSNSTQGFHLLMRLYGITPSAFDGVQSGTGWKPPTVLPCDGTGHTATGIACAS